MSASSIEASSASAKPAASASSLAGTRSEPSASSSSPKVDLQNFRSLGSASSAEKPAAQLVLSSLEATTWSLHGVLPMLQKLEKEPLAQKLVEDIPKLQKWQDKCQEQRKPSNEVRDAMMKLGPRWDVKQNEQGKKRPPAEVARELEERMHKKARELLSRSVAKPSSQSNLDVVESSTQEFLTPTSSVAKPAPQSIPLVDESATPDSSTLRGSVAKSASRANPRGSLYAHFAPQKRSFAELVAMETKSGLAPEELPVSKAPHTVTSSTVHSDVGPQSAAEADSAMKVQTELTLANISLLLQHRASEPRVQRLNSSVRQLRNWTSIPSNRNRGLLWEACAAFSVMRTVDRQKRKPADLAGELKERLLEEAAVLLGYRETPAWKTALEACVIWVKQHRDEDDNEALKSILVLSEEVLRSPTCNVPSHVKPAMKAELLPLRPQIPNGTQGNLSPDLASYAFAQHATRDLRAHTSSWTETLRNTAPSQLRGRP